MLCRRGFGAGLWRVCGVRFWEGKKCCGSLPRGNMHDGRLVPRFPCNVAAQDLLDTMRNVLNNFPNWDTLTPAQKQLLLSQIATVQMHLAAVLVELGPATTNDEKCSQLSQLILQVQQQLRAKDQGLAKGPDAQPQVRSQNAYR